MLLAHIDAYDDHHDDDDDNGDVFDDHDDDVKAETELQNVISFTQSKSFNQILPHEKCVSRNKFDT